MWYRQCLWPAALGWLLSVCAVQAQPTPPDADSLLAADAFIRQVFEQQDSARFDTAAETYLTLLQNLEGTLPDGLHALRRRHLMPLAWILPDDVREAVGLPADTVKTTTRLPEGAAARLLTWWRRMDTLPATPRNERVIEHLARIAYANAHYRDETTQTGLDDRGPIYVRYGPPSHFKKIVFNDTRYIGRIIPAPEFIENEFWVYRQVDDAAQYLFIRPRKLEGYRLGLPQDLIPSTLRSPRHVRVMLEVMEQLYRDLSLYHQTGHYWVYYERIASYTDALAASRYGVAPSSMMPPFSFVQVTLGEAEMADRRAVRLRDEQMPPSYTNLLDEVDVLPVALRWARFLDEDGTTRTELYWNLNARNLYPSRRVRRRLRKEGYETSDDYLITFTATRQTEDYRPRERYRQPLRIHLPRDSTKADITLSNTPTTVPGSTGRYAMALQWDVYWGFPVEADTTVRFEPKIQANVRWLDTLQALNDDPNRLEMSDLKPLHLVDASAPPETAPAYPGDALTPDTPLALYFELYHLTRATDGRTHYNVAYRIAHDERSGGLLRLRNGATQTTAATSYSGSDPTTHEIVGLDLSAWEGTGTLLMAVRVTDETSGETVERTLTFELRPSPR